MFHSQFRIQPSQNIQRLGRVLDMQVPEIIVRSIERASMTRLNLEVVGETGITGIKALPIGLGDGTVECEGAVRELCSQTGSR